MKIKSLLIGAIALLASSLAMADSHFNFDGPGSLPPNPEEGQCYVHKFYPPEYSAEEVQVVVKEGYTWYEYIPPVIVLEDRFFTFDLPDTYEITDPVFETEEVRIMIKPDDPVWHVKCCKDKKRPCKGSCPYPRGEHNHDVDLGDDLLSGYHGDKCGSCGPKKKGPCEQACFKKVRPIYKTYVVQRTVSDGSYDLIQGGTDVVIFKVPVIASKAEVVEHVVEPEFATFTVYTLDHPGYMEWVEGTCKKYTCNPIDLQMALADRGYYEGAIDGIIGPNTIDALNRFRADKGLGIHDSIDKETADALGIKN